MAAQRPWWHGIVAELSTEPVVPLRSGDQVARLAGVGASAEPQYGEEPVDGSSRAISTGGFISRKVAVWDPGSPAMEWVRQATHDGRALAIRRAQDARSGRGAHVLGITPIVTRAPAPRASDPSGPQPVACLLPGHSHDSIWPIQTLPFGAALPPPPHPRASGPPTLTTSFVSPTAEAPRPSSSDPSTAQVGGALTRSGPAAPPTSLLAVRSLEHDADQATLVAGRPPSSEGPVTFYGTPTPPPSFPTLPLGAGAQAPGTRRAGLSSAPPVGCTLPLAPETAPVRKGKGAKHARLCAGPWASALQHLPPLPLTGAKRAHAGLSHVNLTSEDIDRVRRERAACALVSILPWAAAGFVLGDSDQLVSSRPAAETTSRLVRALSAYGASSVDAAHSALGRLMSWVVVHHPEARVVEGSHVSDFLEHARPSAATLAALTWLRDHCGLAIPARGPACRPYRGLPPSTPHTKESLSLGSVVGLEYLAANHPSAHVRGQAGGWSLLARLALRVEQAQSCVLNAVVSHEFEGKQFTIVVGSVRRDKNPNPALRRPRPVWGVIDGLDYPRCLYDALHEMLSGVESSRFLIRDTDSPDGDPTRATAWVAAPLRGAARVDASLQALLRLPPISLSEADAARHHGHSAKRFLLNVAEASGAFSPVESTELGRFSLSTAQSHDLEPVAALLQAHTIRASVLPDIYAGKAKVARVFDLLAKAHVSLVGARAALALDPAIPGSGSASWGAAGPFAELQPPPAAPKAPLPGLVVGDPLGLVPCEVLRDT